MIKMSNYNTFDLAEYVNTAPAANLGGVELSVADVQKAAILSGLPTLVVGHSEKGKSFFAKQVNDHWLGGRGILIQAASLDESVDLFTQVYKSIDLKQGKYVIDKSKIESPFVFADEIGAIPKPLQSQFFPIGDGYIPHEGKRIFLGTPLGDGRRYLSLFGCTNTIRASEDGDYGNFGIVKAVASRFNLCIDLRGKYRRSLDDVLDIMVKSNNRHPRHQEALQQTDITDQMIETYKEIMEASNNPSPEELIAAGFLQASTRQCKKGERFEDDWQDKCDECKEEAKCPVKSFYLFEMMRSNNAVLVFANALAHIAKLKNPKAEIDQYDAVFEAAKFVIAGKYSTMNELLMREENKTDSDFVDEGVNALRKEFNKNKPFIKKTLLCMERYQEVPTQFIESPEGKIHPVSEGFFNDLADLLKQKKTWKDDGEALKQKSLSEGKLVTPYTDDYVSWKWLEGFLNKHKDYLVARLK